MAQADRESRTGLGEFVERTYSQFSDDRKETETKWEKNFRAFNKTLVTKKTSTEAEDWRSQTFIGITKQKIVAAHAIIMDTIMKGSKLPFSISVTNMEAQNVEDLPRGEQEALDQDIQEMTATIADQMAQANSYDHFSKSVFSGAIYGEAIGKTFENELTEATFQEFEEEDGSISFERLPETFDTPAWESLPIWDIFRDIENDDLQKGRAVIHRKMVSAFALKSMEHLPYAFPEAIDIAIEEGKDIENIDDTGTLPPAQREIVNRKNNIRVLEFWGRVPISLAEEFEREMNERSLTSDTEIKKLVFDHREHEDTGEEIEVMILLANENVIRYVRTEPNERPFVRSVWEESIDQVYPTGVADNLEEIQTLLNTAVRGFEDNKQLSSSFVLAMKRRLLENPVDTIHPGMIIDLSEDADDVRQAIQQVSFNDTGESFMSMINLALQFADDESNIPRIQQGSSGAGQETAFELSQRLEKSGKYLGSVIRNFDNGFIQPIIDAFLDFNMDDENLAIRAYKIKANGFSSFQDRISKLTALRQALEMALAHPELSSKVKIEEIYKDFTELLDIDVDRWMMNSNEEELKEERAQAAAQQQQELMALEIAKTESEIQKTNAEAQKIQTESNAKIAEIKIRSEELKLKQLEAAAGSV